MAESTTSFTTWRDLVEQLKCDLMSRAFRTMQSYSVAGRQVSYRGVAELRALLEWAEERAAEEDGTGYVGRTYAVNGGRG
ncbi:MAG: hypothetical protein LBV79_10555 [Candidatus Adiutrix sp.]|jgi:hypothetical protein|nr:hypothetical protein [Candidatus Adiutrix sp.]